MLYEIEGKYEDLSYSADVLQEICIKTSLLARRARYRSISLVSCTDDLQNGARCLFRARNDLISCSSCMDAPICARDEEILFLSCRLCKIEGNRQDYLHGLPILARTADKSIHY